MKALSALIFLITGFCASFCWGAPMKNLKSVKKETSMELIVVFKKEITEAAANDVLKSYKLKFRSGMDSSRGRLYFYNTGPKFIITLDKNTDPEIKVTLEKREDIHEVYEPDWDIQKD